MSNLQAVGRAFKWAGREAWEKVNVVGTWRTLQELRRKHGKRFFWVALIWEIIEDGLFPLLSYLAGVPALIPIFWIFHFEPIAYPAIFWGLRQWDRHKGRIPWEPDRPVASRSLRSMAKVGLYQAVTWGWLWAFLAPLDGTRIFGAMGFFVGLMTLFGYVHERVWHDSNYGILPNDVVQFSRPFAKTLTYRLVSVSIMASALHAIVPDTEWVLPMISYQAVATVFYLALECLWSKTPWGIYQCKTPIVNEKGSAETQTVPAS